MKLQLLTAVATTALLAVPSLAYADGHDEGWYLRGNVGYGAHTDIDITGELVGDVESEGNVAGSLGVGYDFGNNWRLELDGTTLWTDLGAIGQNPSSFAKLRTSSAMINALYDFDDFGRWEPYVGAGIGVAQSDARAEAHDLLIGGLYGDNPACPNGLASATCSINEHSTDLAWQLIAGLGYKITDKLTWDTQYRYQNMGDADYDTAVVSGPPVVTGRTGPSTFEDVGAHMIMTGFRYNFGAKATMVTCWDGSEAKMLANCPDRPPAMKVCWDGSEILASASCPIEPPRMQTCWDGSEIPVTSTCPPQRQTFVCTDGTVVYDTIDNCPVIQTALCPNTLRQEIIYYEFDRGNSAETAPTISRILNVGDYCRIDGVRVVGHTDTSGSAAYNLGLSQRRAKDARDELVKQGVSSAIITSEGQGETQPFVPTGDGVREQLNRRTEVLLTLSEVGVIN